MDADVTSQVGDHLEVMVQEVLQSATEVAPDRRAIGFPADAVVCSDVTETQVHLLERHGNASETSAALAAAAAPGFSIRLSLRIA